MKNFQADEWFMRMAARDDLPAEVAERLRDLGYVVLEGPVVGVDGAHLSEAYDAAVSAAHLDM